MKEGRYYILISILFWMMAEYITSWHGRIAEWVSAMPWIFIYYVGYPLIFYYVIFKRKWSQKKVFFLMLAIALLLELSWKNSVLLNRSTFMLAIVLLISIYGFLTFIPLWLVERSLGKHKIQAAYYLSWIPLGFLIYYFKK